jgi:hypothetical protein
MDGVIRPVGDPLWQRWSPPAGHRCRCTLRQIGRRETREIQRRLEGLAFVSNPANSANMMANAVKFGAMRMVKDASAGLLNAVWPKLSQLRDEKAWIELCMNAGIDRLDNKPYPELP